VRVGCGTITGAIFYCYIVVSGDQDFSLYLLFSSFNRSRTLVLSLLVLLSLDFFIALSDGERAFSGS
jgi:hypothetical protein